MTTATYKVDDMTCGHWVNAVSGELFKLPGVSVVASGVRGAAPPRGAPTGRERLIVGAGAAGFLVAACGRLLSIRRLGQPNALQRVLLGPEVVIPL